jgi:hypothetical protein
MPAVYDLAPVIAEIIAAHCPGTSAKRRFLHACLGCEWLEVRSMVDGMLVEPGRLRGYQEARLREFRELLPATAHAVG